MINEAQFSRPGANFKQDAPLSPDLKELASLLPGDDDPGRKRYRAGTHRVCSPTVTLAKLSPRLAEFGITRVADITGLDRIGIPVAVAIRPNSRNLSVSQGKGLKPAAAAVSAVMESIELEHAESIRLPRRFGCYASLVRELPLIEMEDLPFAAGREWTPETPIFWIEGFDLLQRQPVWLPFELVHADASLPWPPSSGFFQANSNGLASGNILLEAVSSGLCEVIERDAIALWQLRPDAERDATRLALAGAGDAGGRLLLERFAAAGIDVTAWDLAGDAGVPVFRCMICERREDRLHFGYYALGMGCHPDRGVAFSRALTEAAQSRLTFIAGSRDDVFREEYLRLRDPDWKRFRFRHLRPGAGERDFRAAPHWRASSLRQDVAWLLARLRDLGVARVVAVNLSRPGSDIFVVKMVVPGLEGCHFDPHYRPGRRARRAQERAT